jgi:integrase
VLPDGLESVTSAIPVRSPFGCGRPAFRLYDLRHTYASLLLAGRTPITYVSAQLGHANPTTTLRYYAKWKYPS